MEYRGITIHATPSILHSVNNTLLIIIMTYILYYIHTYTHTDKIVPHTPQYIIPMPLYVSKLKQVVLNPSTAITMPSVPPPLTCADKAVDMKVLLLYFQHFPSTRLLTGKTRNSCRINTYTLDTCYHSSKCSEEYGLLE